MLKLIKAKLASKRGETLVESLFSIVIVTLSITMFTVAAVTASRAGTAAKEKTSLLDDSYSSATERSEVSDTAEIYVVFNDVPLYTYSVNVYGDGTLKSFEPKE